MSFSFKNLKHYLINAPGWHTNRKIVVFHSDDWGSIRMPSIKVREKLNHHPDIMADDPYCFYDTLESTGDLEALFEVLQSVKDRNGKPAALTANCLMANPDFDRIKAANFEKYYFETIDKTFARYNNEGALDLWRQGQEAGIFIPQFHGREHVNVSFWLEKLARQHAGVRLAFDYGVFGVNFKNLCSKRLNFQAAWDCENEAQEAETIRSIQEGINLFEKYFGAPSQTAIAPAYVWSAKQEDTLWNLGVRLLQGIPFQYTPSYKKNGFVRKFRCTEFNSTKMSYQMRNAFFEPSLDKGKDTVEECLRRIKNSFQMRKPAIVGSHRINFIGSLDERNRTNNLMMLSRLLKKIVNQWPEVEFMTAPQLSHLMGVH